MSKEKRQRGREMRMEENIWRSREKERKLKVRREGFAIWKRQKKHDDAL